MATTTSSADADLPLVRSPRRGMTGTLSDSPGRSQVCLLVLIGLNYAIVAINHALPTFHGYTPPFSCVQTANETINETAAAGCVPEGGECEGGYTFSSARNDHTIVTEWQLVCSRRLLRPLVATLYFCGVTLGALVGGLAADRFGRRPTLLVGLYGQGALGLGLYAATSLEAFIGIRFVQGFFESLMQGATFTLLIELFPTKSCTGVGVALEVYWGFGLAFLAGCSFLLPDWRNLQLALSVPTALTLLYVCVVPESPRWLSTRGRHVDAAKALHLIAKRNGSKNVDNVKAPSSGGQETLPKESRNGTSGAENRDLANGVGRDKGFVDFNPTDGVEFSETEAKDNRERESKLAVDNSIVIGFKSGNVTEEKKHNFLDLFRNKVLRKYICIMNFSWFSIMLSYYGIMFSIPDLSGDRHLNFLIGAVLEVASYLLSYFVLSRFGRRLPLSFYLILSGIICATVGGIGASQYANESTLAIVQTALALIGKGAVVSAFCAISIYTAELFPTVVRAAASGFCGFWGRVGSLLAPQLLLLGEVTTGAVPLVTMGVLVIVAGVATLFLPETLGSQLTDTIEQAEEMQTKRKRKV